jgi:hypothetical protein
MLTLKAWCILKDFRGSIRGHPVLNAIRGITPLLRISGLIATQNYQSAMANKILNNAKSAKKDEFYTQLIYIERELQHYWQHFRGKTILCNCDDPYESNFFKYFALQFNQLGLKKLICTCYNGSPFIGNELPTLFDEFEEKPDEHKTGRKAYKAVITEVKDLNGDGAVDLADVRYLLQNDRNVISQLKTGDFRSAECIDLLKEADIVVTNPPFSLFREYVAQLMKYDKKFVIIGNQNATTYKEIFPYIKNNKLWLSYNCGDMAFRVPDDYPPMVSRYWIDEKGKKWRSLGNICWFTNLEIPKRNEFLDLVCRYSPEEYPKYENYDAIEVSRTADIPCDYDGAMGVPITFLDKYCPEQFEIIGASESEGKGFSCGLWHKESQIAQPIANGKRTYKRLFIKLLNAYQYHDDH